MNPCLLEPCPLGQDSHHDDVKMKLDSGQSALYWGLFPLFTVPPVSWRFPKCCHLLTWHHCPFLDPDLKPLLCQGPPLLPEGHSASESSKMPSKIQSHYAPLPLGECGASLITQLVKNLPAICSPALTFGISKLLLTTSEVPSWAQTRVSPRHSSSSFILAGDRLSSLPSLGMSLFLMVAWLPRASFLKSAPGPVYCPQGSTSLPPTMWHGLSFT